MFPEEEQESYRIPFIKYHSGWERARGCFKTLLDKMEQNRRGYSVTKNFCGYADRMEGPSEHAAYELSEEGMESLEEFLNFLKEENIENVLFIRCPNRDLSKKGDTLKKAETMVTTAGFDFLDTTEDAEVLWGLNDDTDYYDGGHLNIYGAEKYTKYLARELNSRYQFPKNHETSVTRQWDACAAYNKKVFEKAKRLTDEHYHEGLYTQSDFLK
ncbi:MAG: hypothetical protein MJ092_04300 [Lachnospiraceae bacterium]|nr:hypothetical protein [Lachnospiraceae bacterium]